MIYFLLSFDFYWIFRAWIFQTLSISSLILSPYIIMTTPIHTHFNMRQQLYRNLTPCPPPIFGQNCATLWPHCTRASSRFPVPADVPSPRSSNAISPQSSAALPSASGAGSDSRSPTPVPAPAAAEGATAPEPPAVAKVCQTGKGCQALLQGRKMNKPVFACIGVSACTVREISALKFEQGRISSAKSSRSAINFVLRRNSTYQDGISTYEKI
jgi:hypothetical protein